MSANLDCPKCGAPQKPGYVLCPFCKAPYSEEVKKHAIPCKSASCREPSAWGQTRCVKCNEWIVVKCLFCGNISPHTMSACLTCNEAFQGMAERKAAQEAEARRLAEMQQSQQTAQNVAAYGGVAANFLGAFAGAALAQGGGIYHHEVNNTWIENPIEQGDYNASFGDAFSGDDSSGSDDSGW